MKNINGCLKNHLNNLPDIWRIVLYVKSGTHDIQNNWYPRTNAAFTIKTSYQLSSMGGNGNAFLSQIWMTCHYWRKLWENIRLFVHQLKCRQVTQQSQSSNCKYMCRFTGVWKKNTFTSLEWPSQSLDLNCTEMLW